MKNILIVLIILFYQLLTPALTFATGDLNSARSDLRGINRRVQILEAYFQKYNSPLKPYSRDFVMAADKYNLDWRFVVAISGVESTFGKFIPGGTDPRYSSNNGWGWGVYGTQAIYFKSWTEGIYTVSAGLRKNYLDKGLVEPYSINRVYAASSTWGSHVTYFLEDIARFADLYEKDHPELRFEDLAVKIAGASAKIN